MYISVAWKRPFVWLSRFRHRRGYGVHSPFAFDLITQVVYEHLSYYAYKPLEAEQRAEVRIKGRGWVRESRKVNRLLFRLVNRAQPATIIDAGTLSASSLYLRAGKKNAGYLSVARLSELFLEQGVPVGFLYLHHFRDANFVEQVFDACVSRVTENSIFVIEGICYNAAMKNLWRRMQADGRVGITFDLYDLGILFFDKTKIKQHYIVNF